MDAHRALFANDALYVAFTEGDLDAMDRLWARDHEVSCIHPGWPAMFGREAVMDSWRGILDNPDHPSVRPHHARAVVQGSTITVICYEHLGDAMLVATNVFVEEDGEARLVHHQAGPCAEAPAPEVNQVQ